MNEVDEEVDKSVEDVQTRAGLEEKASLGTRRLKPHCHRFRVTVLPNIGYIGIAQSETLDSLPLVDGRDRWGRERGEP